MSYYCVLIALSIYYLVASCQAVLPWTVCWEELQVFLLTLFLEGVHRNSSPFSRVSTKSIQVITMPMVASTEELRDVLYNNILQLKIILSSPL